MTALRVAGASKRFDGVVAVDDVSFELGDHELTLATLCIGGGQGGAVLLERIAR